MGIRSVDGGARRWKAVQVGGGVAVLAAVLFALPALRRPPPTSTALDRSDIHTEYVKFPSGRDTITAYLAYPERKDRAPAPRPRRSRAYEPRGSACTPRTTPASTPGSGTSMLRCGPTTRATSTASTPGSATASSARGNGLRWRTALGVTWLGSSGRVSN